MISPVYGGYSFSWQRRRAREKMGQGEINGLIHRGDAGAADVHRLRLGIAPLYAISLTNAK